MSAHSKPNDHDSRAGALLLHINIIVIIVEVEGNIPSWGWKCNVILFYRVRVDAGMETTGISISLPNKISPLACALSVHWSANQNTSPYNSDVCSGGNVQGDTPPTHTHTSTPPKVHFSMTNHMGFQQSFKVCCLWETLFSAQHFSIQGNTWLGRQPTWQPVIFPLSPPSC